MDNEKTIIERDIKWVRTPEKNQVGSGHQNRLLLEPGNWEEFDPFLLLAEDWFQKGSFGLHPHRGMETVTYVIEGKLEHFDNNGGKDQLLPGDAQWMTAGRGVIHLEDPAEGETVHSLQLWVNLPSGAKMVDPRYQNIRSKEVPVYEEKGVTVRVFSGSYSGIASETLNHTPVTMVEYMIEAGESAVQKLPGSYNGFLVVLKGEGTFGKNGTQGFQGQVLWLGSAETDRESEVRIEAKTALKVLLYAGKPLREPVVSRGPFVMNTEEQIKQAYQDYHEGKFE
jgi:redox-sensitive bicupin YhaK (pirin superfamily)